MGAAAPAAGSRGVGGDAMILRQCDKCHKTVRFDIDVFERDRERWLELQDFPVPVGHVSRTDSVEKRTLLLCDSCNLSLREWFIASAKPEERKP